MAMAPRVERADAGQPQHAAEREGEPDRQCATLARSTRSTTARAAVNTGMVAPRSAAAKAVVMRRPTRNSVWLRTMPSSDEARDAPWSLGAARPSGAAARGAQQPGRRAPRRACGPSRGRTGRPPRPLEAGPQRELALDGSRGERDLHDERARRGAPSDARTALQCRARSGKDMRRPGATLLQPPGRC